MSFTKKGSRFFVNPCTLQCESKSWIRISLHADPDQVQIWIQGVRNRHERNNFVIHKVYMENIRFGVCFVVCQISLLTIFLSSSPTLLTWSCRSALVWLASCSSRLVLWVSLSSILLTSSPSRPSSTRTCSPANLSRISWNLKISKDKNYFFLHIKREIQYTGRRYVQVTYCCGFKYIEFRSGS